MAKLKRQQSSAESRAEELVAQIQKLVSDDDMFNILEDAEANEAGVVDYLERALAALTSGELTDQDGLLAKFKLSVVPKTMGVRDRKTRETVQQPIGFIVRRETENGPLYAGRQGSWSHPNYAVPLNTVAEAQRLAYLMASQLQLQEEVYSYDVTLVQVKIPVEAKPAMATQISSTLVCSGREATALLAILRGLRAQNQIADGERPVATVPDALRFVLREVAKQLGI